MGAKITWLRQRLRGSVTVFFVLILVTMLLLFGLLFYLAEKNVAQTEGSQILEVSANAVLSEFDRAIEEKFGFYSVSSQKVNSGLRFYLKENTQVAGPIFMDSLEVNAVEGRIVHSLADQAVIKQQIQDFMEVRGLVEAADLLIRQFSDVKDGAETAQEELNNYSGMEAYNKAYLKVVEILEGVHEDGSSSQASIRHYEEKVFPKGSTPNLESVSFIYSFQELYELNEKLKNALWDLRIAAGTIEGDEKAALPLNETQVRALESRRLHNSLLMFKLLGVMNEEESDQEKHQKNLTTAYAALKADYQEIHVEYEIKEKVSYSITQLKKALFGEAANLKIYAPNEDKVERGTSIYANMPSHGNENLLQDASDIESYSSMLEENINSVLEDALFRAQLMLYISGMLTNLSDTIQEANGKKTVNMRQKSFVAGIFNNEAEYLYFGSVNEYYNIQAVKGSIIALRTVLNMVTLLSDSDKMDLIKTLASSTGGCVVPGIGEKVIEILLVTAWCIWEASSDWTALVNGKKISLIKAKEEWQTDLDSILGSLTGNSDTPNSPSSEGNNSFDALDYSGYLMLCLNAVPTGLLLARIQDLVYLEKGGQNLHTCVYGFVAKGVYTTAGLKFSFERYFSY